MNECGTGSFNHCAESDTEKDSALKAKAKEKVYDVLRTPSHHLIGVSKSNKKLTFVLKETY